MISELYGCSLKFTSNKYACVAQLVECSLGKAEVTGSIPVVSSIFFNFWQGAMQELLQTKNIQIQM